MTIYHRARRAKKKQLNKKKVTTCLLLGVILCSVIYLLVSNKIWAIEDENVPNTATSEEVKEETVAPIKEEKDELSDVEIPATMGKYEILGQLVIEKIGVTKNILNISEDESLKLSVAKLYGPDVNASGNFCISGHNWNNML